MPLKSPYPPVPPIPSTNVHNLLFYPPDLAQRPDHTIYIDALTGNRWTRKQLLDRVYDAATSLGTPASNGGLGITDTEIVGIMSDNCLDYIVLVHALLVLTIPFALLPSHATPMELNHVLQISKVTRIFSHGSLLHNALGAFKRADITDDRIYILEGRSHGRLTFDNLISNVTKSRVPRIPVRQPKKDALAYLVFSSGTSGLPKAVMISQDNIRYSIAQAITAMQVGLEASPPPTLKTAEGIPVGLSVLPFYHSYGLHLTMFRIFVPSTFVILSRWDVEVALDAIAKYQVTSLGLVPSIVHQLVSSPRFGNADLSSVNLIYCGGAYLPPQLASKLTGIIKHVNLAEGYGMSEATISAIGKPPPNLVASEDVLPGCTGVLSPGMEARIVRDDGSDADFDESGELFLKGGNIALGYWNNEEATKESFLDEGWLRTGDRFRVNGRGLFFFEDRTKDTLKVSGHQVSPVEIENVLLAHPDKLISDASVAGVAGGRTSDEKVPRAWAVLSSKGQTLGEATVRTKLEAWTQQNLSKYKWLRGGIGFVNEIPKSPTGKVLRRILQEQHAQKLTLQAKL